MRDPSCSVHRLGINTPSPFGGGVSCPDIWRWHARRRAIFFRRSRRRSFLRNRRWRWARWSVEATRHRHAITQPALHAIRCFGDHQRKIVTLRIAKGSEHMIHLIIGRLSDTEAQSRVKFSDPCFDVFQAVVPAG